MRRPSPLKRTRPLKPRRSTPRTSSRVRDNSYMEKVRGLPCVCIEMLSRECPTPGGLLTRHQAGAGCYGPIHAHHMREVGKAGMGQKPDDSLCVPFCESHHSQWHSASVTFKGLSREWRVAFAIAAVQATRSALNWHEDKENP